MSKPLTFDTIGDLYRGHFRAEVDRAIKQALMDCDDRPGLSNKRTVTITLEMTPQSLMDSGDLDGVGLSASVAARLPKIKGGVEAMVVETVEDKQGNREIRAAFAQPQLLPDTNLQIIPEGSN